MTAQEALAYMQQTSTEYREVRCKSLVGTFHLIGDRVFFGCPGEYPCCHDDTSIEQFLEDNRNEEFEGV